ncbi:MAG: hypothetical protein ACE37D_00215 [Pseudomonadales bacterium]
MSSDLLDELTVEDQRTIALSELDPFLAEVTPQPEEVSFWLRVIEWLWERLADSEMAQNQWFTAFGEWLFSHWQLLVYFFYISAGATVLFGLYLLYRVFQGIDGFGRRPAQAANSAVSQSIIAEQFFTSEDPVIQAYGEFLFQMEETHYVEQAFTLSPRELADHLHQNAAPASLRQRFSSLFPQIDRYLYGKQAKPPQPQLVDELHQVTALAQRATDE